MTINHNELLSALIDGELQGEEFEKALQILATNEQAVAQFQRYQQSTDILKGYTERGLTSHLSNRISTALADEPIFSRQVTTKKADVIAFPKPFWKQLTGLAVAASVGALAVMGVMTQAENDYLTNIPVAAIEKSEVITVAKTSTRWTVDEPEVESRLNTYLLDHNELAGSSGVFSYARVVSYGSE